MSETGFWDDSKTAEAISKQFGDLKTDTTAWQETRETAQMLEELAEESSNQEELDSLETDLKATEEKFKKLEIQKLFTGKYDANNAILSIHAGAGGVDAQDWSEILLRMYLRFAESQSWKTEILSETRGTEAGIKSVSVKISGDKAYGHLKTEAGVHRLVRLSPFNADSLRQTSFALVDVIPEITENEEVNIDADEMKIDTFMSSGPGGQGVNTTYSAVRITHIPSGIVVSCQNERSQTQNKETAMMILRGKLLQKKLEEQQKELDSVRGEVTSAEWGSQIRSYVLHPYKMVKDHRTKKESSDTDAVLNGEIIPFIDARLRQIAS